MSELPLLANSQVALNIGDGKQTMDRRPVKDSCLQSLPFERISPVMNTPPTCRDGVWYYEYQSDVCDSERVILKAPHQVGDLLYLRENIRCLVEQTQCHKDFEYGEFLIEYCADKQEVKCPPELEEWWRHNWHVRPSTTIPNIHMPKLAARTWVRVKRVWVEQNQDISEADAKAEGVEPLEIEHLREMAESFSSYTPYRFAYSEMYDKLYPGAWDNNIWNWCTEFELIEYPQSPTAKE